LRHMVKYLLSKGLDDEKQVYYDKVKQVSQIDILRKLGLADLVEASWRLANALYEVFI
jgi:hypothetical protein